ncbi:MAG: Kelch repeat-containing protein [Planctomycetota bacterium]
MKTITAAIFGLALAAPAVLAAEIPANTWVRIAGCPGDAEGREVPPGRAATWCYVPPLKAFVRYGGYTPRFSNAMDMFDPATRKWTRLACEDENYPENRPGGGCRWALCWDPGRKALLIGGGAGNGWTGSRGVWSYDPKSRKFTRFSRDLPKGAVYGCFDPKAGIFLAQQWPKSSGLGQGVTPLLTLADGKWHRARTPESPQPQWGGRKFPMVYHEKLGRIVLQSWEKKGSAITWAFDAAGRKWEKLAISKHPPARVVTAAAYDPDHAVVLLHGGSDGRRAENGTKEDTWVLDVEKKEWREIRTPGPPPMKGHKGRNEILYRQALAYDTDLKRFLFSDPDLGVWAFRYDPKAEPGKAAASGGFVPKVSAAASNPPPEIPEGKEEELAEKRLKLPSELNKRILNMPDNSVLQLGGGAMPGNEVGWCYDSDAGVMVKYGGCGNWSNPFWAGYGNPLIFYDPGTERWFTRRVGDISGAKRPATGCTRSVCYDSGRKLTWIFGNASSGPYCPGSTGAAGYDIVKDLIITPKSTGARGMGNTGCLLTYSPDHKVAMIPRKEKTWIFDPAAESWTPKAVSGSPGKPASVYERVAYVKSTGSFLFLTTRGTAPDAKKGVKDTRENRTMAYDHAAGKWTDLAPKNQPPYRACKYGLVYDSRNDVVILVGGQRGWNKGAHKDLWVYHVKKNEWEKMTPSPAGGEKKLPDFDYTLPTAYDSRHNAVIFCCRNRPWAYRYKK